MEPIEALRAGRLVLVATDSVAGLAARPEAAAALAQAKGRAASPFAWVFAQPADVVGWWLPSALPPGGLERLWEEGLTLVVPGEPQRPEAGPPLGSGALGLGLRLGGPPSLRQLAAAADTPYLLTSANLSGAPATAAVGGVDPALRSLAAASLNGSAGSGEPTPVVAWTASGPQALRGPLPEVVW